MNSLNLIFKSKIQYMKNIKITLLAAAIAMASCSKKEELASGIIKKNMDTLVNPGDDFQAYVNGTWIKNNKIPADKASYGAFDMLSDQSQKNVKAIIEEAAKGNSAEGSDEQKIGDYYASFINRKERDSKGIKPIESELKNIDAIALQGNSFWFYAMADEDWEAQTKE